MVDSGSASSGGQNVTVYNAPVSPPSRSIDRPRGFSGFGGSKNYPRNQPQGAKDYTPSQQTTAEYEARRKAMAGPGAEEASRNVSMASQEFLFFNLGLAPSDTSEAARQQYYKIARQYEKSLPADRPRETAPAARAESGGRSSGQEQNYTPLEPNYQAATGETYFVSYSKEPEKNYTPIPQDANFQLASGQIAKVTYEPPTRQAPPLPTPTFGLGITSRIGQVGEDLYAPRGDQFDVVRPLGAGIVKGGGVALGFWPDVAAETVKQGIQGFPNRKVENLYQAGPVFVAPIVSLGKGAVSGNLEDIGMIAGLVGGGVAAGGFKAKTGAVVTEAKNLRYAEFTIGQKKVITYGSDPNTFAEAGVPSPKVMRTPLGTARNEIVPYKPSVVSRTELPTVKLLGETKPKIEPSVAQPPIWYSRAEPPPRPEYYMVNKYKGGVTYQVTRAEAEQVGVKSRMSSLEVQERGAVTIGAEAPAVSNLLYRPTETAMTGEQFREGLAKTKMKTFMRTRTNEEELTEYSMAPPVGLMASRTFVDTYSRTRQREQTISLLKSTPTTAILTRTVTIPKQSILPLSSTKVTDLTAVRTITSERTMTRTQPRMLTDTLSLTRTGTRTSEIGMPKLPLLPIGRASSSGLPRYGFEPGSRSKRRRVIGTFFPRLTYREKTLLEMKRQKPVSVFVPSTPKTRAIFRRNLFGNLGRSGFVKGMKIVIPGMEKRGRKKR